MRIWQWFTSPYPTMEEFKAGNTWPRISITPYLDTRNEFIQRAAARFDRHGHP